METSKNHKQLYLFIQYYWMNDVKWASYAFTQRFDEDSEPLIMYNDHIGSTITEETIRTRYPDKKSKLDYILEKVFMRKHK